MIIALGFCSKDVDSAYRLLEFIHQVGGAKEYQCLLVADAGTPWDKGIQMLEMASKVFRTVSFVSTDRSVEGWPEGSNELFLRAAEFAVGINQPFLWLEPDAIPVHRDWLIKISEEYKGGFMGMVYPCFTPGLPSRLLSGIAVYPADTIRMMGEVIRSNIKVAWDVSTANLFSKLATHTTLIRHFNPPKGSPTSFPKTMKVDDIPKAAVLFHSNKDGTLMNEMRKRWGIGTPDSMVVVLPFCNADSRLAEQLLQWIQQLRCPMTHEVLLSYDATTLGQSVKRIETYAGMVFGRVYKNSYRVPHGTRFPQTAAWQAAARAMEEIGRPWMWMEADCVPLRADFLPTLQSAYDRFSRPFAGPIVHARGHVNGTAIYPANTPDILQQAMSHTDNAWDVEAGPVMRPLCADIGSLWFHVWGVVNGRLDPLSGPPPGFDDHLLRQIPASAVILHRCKDGSLFNLLRPRLIK